jgi:hypothetical protein
MKSSRLYLSWKLAKNPLNCGLYGFHNPNANGHQESSMAMTTGNTGQTYSEINMTPLIDVMLVLPRDTAKLYQHRGPEITAARSSHRRR